MRRHEDARDLELERDVAGEQRPRAAGRDEGELARVVAAADGVQLDRLRHPVLLDLQRAERRLLHRMPSSPAIVRHGALGELDGRAASRRRAGRDRAQPAEHELRVRRGRRRRRRARSRPGPGRRRPTAARRGTRRRGRRRRSSRRPRRSCRCRPSAPSPGSRRSSCRAGGACAAAPPAATPMSAEVPPMSSVTTFSKPAIRAGPDAADQPGDGPRHEQVDGPLRRRLDGRHAARRLHQLHAVREARVAHRLVEAGDVARHLRPDVGVQADGREALELAVERQHLVRDGEVRLRELLEQDLLDALLVGRVEVASAASRPRPPRRRPP